MTLSKRTAPSQINSFGSNKQDVLISGTNIKTINGETILGGGDLEVGYKNVPQNSKSADYTTVLSDSAKHLFHPSTDANNRTFTIDSNANVPYSIGTAITFVNMSANNLSIAITSDTMTLAGAGTTGTRTLAQNGIATALKIGTTEWLISGTNLT